MINFLYKRIQNNSPYFRFNIISTLFYEYGHHNLGSALGHYMFLVLMNTCYKKGFIFILPMSGIDEVTTTVHVERVNE